MVKKYYCDRCIRRKLNNVHQYDRSIEPHRIDPTKH